MAIPHLSHFAMAFHVACMAGMCLIGYVPGTDIVSNLGNMFVEPFKHIAHGFGNLVPFAGDVGTSLSGTFAGAAAAAPVAAAPVMTASVAPVLPAPAGPICPVHGRVM